jgi:hypothetical protein
MLMVQHRARLALTHRHGARALTGDSEWWITRPATALTSPTEHAGAPQ